MLVRDKRTTKKILTTDGYQSYSRYRLYAIDTNEFPNSIKNCIALYGSSSIYPLDIYLGIDQLPFKVTPDAALKIAQVGASSSSYKDAAERLSESFGNTLSDNQVREIVDYIGEIVLEEDKRCIQNNTEDYDPKSLRLSRRGRRPKNGFVLYCEVDGAMFNTRTRKADTDATTEDESSSWKENKLCLVFRDTELKETSKKDEYGHTVKRIGKREYICTTQGIEEFRKRVLYLLIKNGLLDASDLVILSDGAVWIRKIRERYFPNATQILDLFHLKENVMSFAQFIHHNDKALYYPWWKEVCKQLEDGKWKDVLDRPEVNEYGNDKDTPKGIVNIYKYIYNNRDSIDYPTYRAKEYFVGSGGIESGNKTVLQERMKLAGMKWYIESAETLLALRAKLKSDLWWKEVVPLVYKKYNTWHLCKESIRQKQRAAHKK